MAHKILTWALFIAAIFATLCSQQWVQIGTSSNSTGAAAGGMWIAFALLYLHDRKALQP